MRLKVIAPGALLLLVGACQPASTEFTDQQKTELAAEVDAAAGAWWSAWEIVDLEQGLSFMSDASESAYLGGDQNLYGVGAMREAWTDWAANLSEQDLDYSESRTFVLAPDIAFTIRNVTGIATRKDGSIRPEIESVETAVWVKRDGEWKILFGHESVLRTSWKTLLDLDS